MNNVVIGLICLCYSLFLFLYSPKEKKNMLGYKSMQQNMHRDIWKWTNQCFGLLMLIGSLLYVATSITLALKASSYSSELYKYGLVYLLISVVLTECYAFMKRYKNKNMDSIL